MKNKLCVSIFILFSLSKLNSQTLVKTYYNFQKTMLKESYFVNSRGEKNGQYKFYSEYNGVLREEATFINGIMVGVYKLYDVSSGRALLQKSETYKNEMKNGSAIYYSYGDDGVAIPTAQGNYINDKKDGVWIYVDVVPFDTPKGFQYFKTTQTVKNDVTVSQGSEFQYYPSNKKYSIELKNDSGSEVKYFYPSGNLRIDGILNSSGEIINRKEFYEDGKVWAELKASKNNSTKVEDTKVWYQNGRLKEHTIKENGSITQFEGYNEDGSKNEKMIANEKQEFDRQNHEKEIEENKKNREKEEKVRQERDEQIKTIKDLIDLINSKNSEFYELCVYFNPNLNCKTYRKGKQFIYEKSIQLIEENIKQFNSEKVIDKSIALGNNTVKFLDKLISLALTDTKELNKKLKKAQTTDEIKQLLEL